MINAIKNIAIKLWGMNETHNSLIASRENHTYKVFNQDKKIFVLRVHRKNYSSKKSAKFSILNEYVWLMQMLEQFDGSKWKKLFVVGEDLEMIKKYITEFEKWLGDIEFYYYSEGTGIKKIR